MHNKFGWDLPPGVTNAMIAAQVPTEQELGEDRAEAYQYVDEFCDRNDWWSDDVLLALKKREHHDKELQKKVAAKSRKRWGKFYSVQYKAMYNRRERFLLWFKRKFPKAIRVIVVRRH